MRRKDREIKELREITAIMAKCQVLSLALAGGEYPYVVPVNFGVYVENESVTLYFHGAGAGTKMELIQADGRAAFCMSAEEEAALEAPACGSTMYYESVCGNGRMTVVTEREEKVRALTCIMKQYDPEGEYGLEFNEKMVEHTTILKLSVKELTGKSNRRKSD